MSTSVFTGTLLKSMDILDCFADDKTELGIKEIADTLDSPESSVYRVVQTMTYLGMLMQDGTNRKYRLGTQLFLMEHRFDTFRKSLEIAAEHMLQLRDEIGENVNLAVRNGDCVILIHKVECDEILRPNYQVGLKYPAYCTGLGKMLLSELSTGDLQYIYNQNRGGLQEQYPDFHDFENALIKIREDGFSIDDEELSKGLRCIAAPILTQGNNMIYAMSVSGPIVRLNDEKTARAKDLVLKYASKISDDMASEGLFM